VVTWPDDQNPLPVPAQGQVGQEPANARRGFPPALPARIRAVQVLTPAGLQFGHRHPVALAVVAFTQPPVVQDGDRRAGEGNGRRLGGARQVGAEHRGDPIAAAAASQLAGLRQAPL
jgi:hypothetical protein